MYNQARAGVNVRIYQLERKLDALRYDQDRAPLDEYDTYQAKIHEIELLIGY